MAAQLGAAAYQEAAKLDDALAAAKYREALKYIRKLYKEGLLSPIDSVFRFL